MAATTPLSGGNNSASKKWGLAPADPHKTLTILTASRCLSPFFHKRSAKRVLSVRTAGFAARMSTACSTILVSAGCWLPGSPAARIVTIG